ncbi:MAG: YcaO-like family protein [Psychromonas sp.]|nr:YcaO-like family protein [Psychromonas sp.]
MKERLYWHPKFNVYSLKNETLLLISEASSFSLPQVDFPLFHEFNGLTSVDEVLAKTPLSAHNIANFLYQLDNFKKQKLLVDQTHIQFPNYIKRYTATSQLLVQEENDYAVINLSQVKYQNVSQWLSLLSQLTIIKQFPSTLGFMLVDSFLNPVITEDVTKFDIICLIKITGDKIWLGPLIKATDRQQYLHALQVRLKHNNPILAIAESQFPNENLCIPYCHNEPLSAAQLQCISNELNKQLTTQQQRIVIISTATLQVEYHPLCLPDKNTQSFSRQVNSKIQLQHCLVNFNIDGGSRTVSPEQTVQSIKPFISPKTGLISHIQALKESADNPVKIYSTAFFKAVALKNCNKLDNDCFIHSCMGKGVSHIQSQASALCEAIERYSAHYQGDEPLYFAQHVELDKRSYSFQQLVPYSESQYQNFIDNNHPDAQLKQGARSYNGEAVHWLPTWSLTEKEQVYLPLTHCFANIPFDDDRFGRWNSNGCAAGNTLEEAILQALFELIERDATAVWWYNRIERPEFDIKLIDAEHLNLLNETLSPDHDFWVLDLTHDIGIPVMAAVGRNKNTQGLSFGFGCHLQKELAAQRALTELCQLIPIRDQNSAPFDFNAVEAAPYLFPAKQAQPQKVDSKASGNIKLDIETIVKKLKKLGLETLVLNYSREPLPIKTAKVFVPGLCHIWPQLANQRLYQVPVDLGWLKNSNSESSINQQPLYI